MPFYFKFRHFVGHENSTDVILCLYKMKRTDWLLQKFGFIKRVDKCWITTVKDLESWRFERQSE